MISDRIHTVTPSYTINISLRVSEMKQQGKDLIDLSIGEPDFNIPEISKAEAIKALNHNKTKYDKAQGLLELRQAIIKKLKNENNLSYKIENIVVSNGAKQALSNTLMAILNPEEEVLVPKPYWVSYPEMIKLVGGIPVFIDTWRNTGYKITPELLSSYVTPKTKMLFLTNPSNPSGLVYSSEQLTEIGNFCVENNIYILSDEIYERICFKDAFTSIASISNAIKDRTITINGFSKSFAMTGLRIGYSISNTEIAKAISIIQGHLTSHPSTISQWAAVASLNKCSNEPEIMKKEYKKRRNTAILILDKVPNLKYLYPEGAFYIFLDISAYKKYLNYHGSFSVAFCDNLLNEALVAAVPGIAFGMDDFIRISYACSEKVLSEGLNRMCDFIQSLFNN